MICPPSLEPQGSGRLPVRRGREGAGVPEYPPGVASAGVQSPLPVAVGLPAAPTGPCQEQEDPPQTWEGGPTAQSSHSWGAGAGAGNSWGGRGPEPESGQAQLPVWEGPGARLCWGWLVPSRQPPRYLQGPDTWTHVHICVEAGVSTWSLWLSGGCCVCTGVSDCPQGWVEAGQGGPGGRREEVGRARSRVLKDSHASPPPSTCLPGP